MKNFEWKVVVIDHESFSHRKQRHYYVDEFLSSGIAVEYWDVSKVLKYSKHIKYNESVEADYVKKLVNFRDIIDSISVLNVENTVLILEFYLKKETLKLYQLIHQRKIKWVRINYYHNPTMYLDVHDSMYNKFLKIFDFKRVINKLNNTILKRYRNLSVPDIAFLTGSEKSVEAKKIVSLDFFDVEEYNNSILIDKAAICEEPYVVFLDIMFSHHPDLQRAGILTISKDIYFEKMRYFFDRLEEKLKKPIIVASHPKANYNGEYGNRMTIKNQTCELVKGADLILTHGSLSISYALLAKKPILYLYFEEMLKTTDMRFYYNRMEKAKKELGTEMININSKDLDFDIPAVQNDKYEEFLKKVYLKNLDDSRSNFQIIQENLVQLIKKESFNK
ncbi:hypothetical protein [Sphingobacterium puteale]|uniref:hypothetical protein n=1 Tax=Sphingobacterium puteale TaxID=2420510 RepID=UPI003D964B66